MDSVKELLAPLGLKGTFLVLVAGSLWWYFSGIRQNVAARGRIIHLLREDIAGKRYRNLLTQTLNWLDFQLSQEELNNSNPDTKYVSWSAGLLDLNLSIALLYPVLSIIIFWGFNGNGSVGGFQFLNSELPIFLRHIISLSIIILGILAIFLILRDGWRANKILTSVVLVCIYFCIEFVGNFEGALAFTSAISIGQAITGVGAFATGGAIAGGIAAILPSIFPSPLILLIIFLLFLLIVLFSSLVAVRIGHRLGLVMALTLMWALAGFGIVVAGIILSPSLPLLRDITSTSSAVLLVGLLPFLNGLADFGSFGLTRYWLRKGTKGNLLTMGFRDALGGTLIFLGLGFSIIATIHFVRPQDGVAILNLNAVFADLDAPATRGNYGWLALMLFSTLLPTLAHVMIAGAAFFTLAPAHWRHWIADTLEEGGRENDDILLKNAWIALTIAGTAAICVPAFVLYYAFTLHGGILDGAIWVFRGFAVLIGAIPPN